MPQGWHHTQSAKGRHDRAYVVAKAIVEQLAPSNIKRHEHPSPHEELDMASANLRKRYGPDTAPLNAAALLATGHDTAHKK